MHDGRHQPYRAGVTIACVSSATTALHHKTCLETTLSECCDTKLLYLETPTTSQQLLTVLSASYAFKWIQWIFGCYTREHRATKSEYTVKCVTPQKQLPDGK
jgi:hypothetical protein